MATKKSTYPEGLRVGRSSAGLGLFATRAFKKGERIIEYFGREITPAEEYTSRSKYLFEVLNNKRHRHLLQIELQAARQNSYRNLLRISCS
jgi:hypothetical protein